MGPQSAPENPYASPPSSHDEAAAGDLDTIRMEVVQMDSSVWLRGYRVHAARSSRVRRIVFPVAGALFLLHAGVTYYFQGWSTATILSLVLALYFLLIVLFVRLIVQRRIVSNMEQTGGRVQEVRYRLEPDWLEIATDNAEIGLRLAGLHMWRADKGVILLYQTSMHYQVIPCFDWSRESTDALQARLRKHLGPPNRKHT